jgi:hypothetical protein
VMLFIVTWLSVGVFGYGSIFLASSRTGAVPFQILLFPLGVVLSGLTLAVMGISKCLNLKSASIGFGVFATLFLACAFAHTRYGSAQTLHSGDCDLRIERKYDDPFDYFVVRWRMSGGDWSARQTIGDSLRHKPPFHLEDLGKGVYLIRDSTGEMQERVGPGVTKEANQGAAANGLSAVRLSVAGIRERTVRSTAAPEAVAELGR